MVGKIKSGCALIIFSLKKVSMITLPKIKQAQQHLVLDNYLVRKARTQQFNYLRHINIFSIDIKPLALLGGGTYITTGINV